MVPATNCRPLQITTRTIAVALVWLSVCLALWTSASALERGYPVLLGWMALCTAVATLFGVALRFALGVIVGITLTILGMAVLAVLSAVLPRGWGVPVVLIVAAAARYLARKYRHSRAPGRSALEHAAGFVIILRDFT
jgi:hypothetical protein